MRGGARGMNGLDDDFLGELRADAQTDVADLADDIGVLSQKADFLFLAKAHFTEPMGDFRSGCKLLYSNRSTCTNVA